MNQPTNLATSPPPRSGGCCGMGCFSVVALIIFFALALVGGAFWAVQHVKHTYLEDKPRPMPEAIAPDEPVTENSSSTETAAAPNPTAVPVREIETRWKTFEKSSDRSEANRIELSAGEINALLQSHRNTRGKAYVSIENNIGHVHVSIPIKNVPMMKGRFLNGEASVEASPDGDPNKARIFNIVLSKSGVSDGVVDQRFFGLSSMRGYIDTWLRDNHITSFRIENNRAVAETNGSNSITR